MDVTSTLTWNRIPVPDDRTIIVTNARGEVCPMVRGIIINNVGYNDWTHGEPVTLWTELPTSPTPLQGDAVKYGSGDRYFGVPPVEP